MEKKEVLERIRACGAILVVRCDDPRLAVPGIRAVVEGGLRVAEVTFTVPDAPAVIRQVCKELGDAVLMGAGTVTEVGQAVRAVEAGAAFLVAPNTDAEVIAKAKALGVPIFPGAFTPTEVAYAWKLGADAVKVFPASVGGPAYIKALKGPFPHIPLVPTGGVDEKTVGEFFKAGIFAVGAGGALFDPKRLKALDYKGMTDVAARFVQAMETARKGL